MIQHERKVAQVNGLIISEVVELPGRAFTVEQYDAAPREYKVYTRDEWACGKDMRYAEMDCGSLAEAKDFARSY